MRILLLMFLLAGCDSLYYRDYPTESTVVTVIVHTDADELTKVCGADIEACAVMKRGHCIVHLPERAGWKWHHELTHCFGRQDAPV